MQFIKNKTQKIHHTRPDSSTLVHSQCIANEFRVQPCSVTGILLGGEHDPENAKILFYREKALHESHFFCRTNFK